MKEYFSIMWGDDLWKDAKKQEFIISVIMRNIKMIMGIKIQVLISLMEDIF